MIFYISDIHFGDLRILKLCSRPFANLEEFENEIIKKWNRKVSDADTVYILGDIAKDNDERAINILKSLNGTKHLIIGNHDLKLLEKIIKSDVFKTLEYISLIEDEGRKVCLCHYPLMDWLESTNGGYHIYGHIHNKTSKNSLIYKQIKDYYKDKLCYNAGVDVTNFEPVTLDEMIRLKEKNNDESYIN